MCGRFVLNKEDLIQNVGGNPSDFTFETSYNIAPSYVVPCFVINKSGSFVMREMQWGFQYTDRESRQKSVINARGETLFEKRMFSGITPGQKCVIPSNGFYEWKRSSSDKTPYYISPDQQGGSFFYYAGLWRMERVSSDYRPKFVIVTQGAEGPMKEVHHRTPLILSKKDIHPWLKLNKQDEIESFIEHYPRVGYQMYPVSKDVNKPVNDGEKLILENK